jgi:hypothetical protein
MDDLTGAEEMRPVRENNSSCSWKLSRRQQEPLQCSAITLRANDFRLGMKRWEMDGRLLRR